MNPSKDKLIDLLSRVPGRPMARSERRQCPDEETLASYLGGDLAGDERVGVETHLASCADCMDELAAAYASVAAAGIEPAPQFLVARVKGLVSGKKSVFDLVVRLTQDAIELIHSSVPVAWPARAAVVRGPASADKVLQAMKTMGRFNITVELEAVEKGMCQLEVNLKDQSGHPAEGIRLSLLSDGREQTSFLTSAAGAAVFERVLPADYQLAIIDEGGLVGAIELSLTREL